MLVHFIGGPAHGRSEAIQNPQPVYRTIELERLPIWTPQRESAALSESVPYMEHVYRITKRTSRYAIAEWEAPKVRVQFQVEMDFDPFDQKVSRRLSEFIYERRSDERDPVRVIATEVYNAEKMSLTLTTEVEGPDDPIAIALAAEKVQQFLDQRLPPGHRRIARTDAVTVI